MWNLGGKSSRARARGRTQQVRGSCIHLSQFLTFMCPVPYSPLFSGVSLRSRAKGRLPIPMVILPFMKHGDLHAFLLASRIGENPFVSAWGGSSQELERDKDPGREVVWVGGEGQLSWLGEAGSEFDFPYASRLPFPS